ncbi:oligosaccharide flippase family protein [Arthrobacter sp. SAFR-014]|uniref:oligosaccharide flippase family protein n=1 Tax=unclassified Arthrobacter TaxID=235627 RepID=UPI003F7B855D
MVTQSKGVEGFALFSIFVALPYMVPISDFGISVSITDTLAKNGPSSAEFRFVWKRTLILLVAIALVTGVIAAVLALSNQWGNILGLPHDDTADVAGLAMMLIMALGIPLGAGQRVMLGLGRQTTATLLGSSSGCISLAMVWLTLSFSTPDYAVLAVAYGLGPLLTQTAIFVIAVRSLKEKWRVSEHADQARPVRILKMALPMAILTVALPLTYQTDRVLLTHFADLTQVADYSFVSMYYMPLLSIITIGSQALWPLYMRMRSSPRRLSREFKRADRVFSALGVVMMLGLVSVGPVVTRIVSDGKGDPPLALFIAFGVMILLFGSNASPGMLLMDHEGRRIQATGACLLLTSKIFLSTVFIPMFGATGAVIATLLPLGVCMIIPTRILATLRLRRDAS